MAYNLKTTKANLVKFNSDGTYSGVFSLNTAHAINDNDGNGVASSGDTWLNASAHYIGTVTTQGIFFPVFKSIVDSKTNVYILSQISDAPPLAIPYPDILTPTLTEYLAEVDTRSTYKYPGEPSSISYSALLFKEASENAAIPNIRFIIPQYSLFAFFKNTPFLKNVKNINNHSKIKLI